MVPLPRRRHCRANVAPLEAQIAKTPPHLWPLARSLSDPPAPSKSVRSSLASDKAASEGRPSPPPTSATTGTPLARSTPARAMTPALTDWHASRHASLEGPPELAAVGTVECGDLPPATMPHHAPAIPQPLALIRLPAHAATRSATDSDPKALTRRQALAAGAWPASITMLSGGD